LNYNDRLLEKQVALLESLVIKITQSDDGPVVVKSSNFSADYERNKSVGVDGGGGNGRDVDDMVMNREERNQRESNRDRNDEKNTYSTDKNTDYRDIDRKLSNFSNDVRKDRSSMFSDRNSNSNSGRQLRRFSVLSVIAKVINKVSTTGAALSEQEERIELARKSGRLLRGVSGALVKTASNTLGFWVGLGFEEEGEKIGRNRRIADDGYDDSYNSDDDYRNRNYGNNNSTNSSESERGSSFAIDNDYIDIAKIIDSDLSFSDQSNRDGASFETADSFRNRKNSNINDTIDDILGSIG
jgi:hypothetical protein